MLTRQLSVKRPRLQHDGSATIDVDADGDGGDHARGPVQQFGRDAGTAGQRLREEMSDLFPGDEQNEGGEGGERDDEQMDFSGAEGEDDIQSFDDDVV